MRLSQKRVLALDPTPKGFGWVAYEGADKLVDWGLVHVQPISNRRCLHRLRAIFDRYPLDALVIEDPTGRGSKRSIRVQQLLVSIEKLAEKKGTEVRRYSRDQIRSAFAGADAWSKEQIAREIVMTHPELAPWLPPIRKIYMAEDIRMSIFDAASLAHTFFHAQAFKRRSRGGGAKTPANQLRVFHTPVRERATAP